MLFKRMISTMVIFSIFLCCCNIVFAKEISLNAEGSAIKEPLIIKNLEIEEYEKSYDKKSGLYVFTLGHPILTCLYQSIIQQTGSGDTNKKSNEITLHDAYGVYNAYKNPESRSKTNKTETRETPKVEIALSEYVPIEGISDIENIADCIVKAKALEGKENLFYPGSSMGYTKINLEITDVYKGDLNIGDIIPFTERYFIAKDGTEIRRDGYVASEVGKEYLFYIGKLDDGLYDPVCTVLGRYYLEDAQTLNGEVDSIEANIVEEYVPLYNQLKEEVMEKYK